MLHKSKNIIWLLILGDALLIIFSFLAGYYARFHVFLTLIRGQEFELYLSALFFVVFIWLALFKFFGLYEEKNAQPFIDEAAAVILAVTLGSLFLIGMLFLNRGLWFSRHFLLYAWLFAVIFLNLFRFGLLLFQRFLYENNYFLRRALILGAGVIGQALAEKLKNKEHGFVVEGFLDDDPKKTGKSIIGLPVLGTISEVTRFIKEREIQDIIVGSIKIPADKVLDIITECEVFKVRFKVVPGMLEMMATRVDADEIGGFPLLTISEIQLQGFKAFLKRTFDILTCTVLSVVVLPLILLLALLVVIDSRGPAFFRQRRIGKDGVPFNMFKFRTMVQGAEEKLIEVENSGDVSGLYFKKKDDPRMTRVGKILRRFSLDEIPQFFNVIKGDMSLVGPRPPLPREVELYNDWHKKRLRVLPGITGLWQVEGKERWDIPFEEVVKLDLLYIENWSLWLDLKIILRTIPVLISGAGC